MTDITDRLNEIRKTTPWFHIPIKKVEVFTPEEPPSKGFCTVHFTDKVSFTADIPKATNGNIPLLVKPTDVLVGLMNSRPKECESWGFSIRNRKLYVEKDAQNRRRNFQPISPFGVKTDDLNDVLHLAHQGQRIAIPLEKFAMVDQPFDETEMDEWEEDFGKLSILHRERASSVKFRWGIDMGAKTFSRAQVERAQKVWRAMVEGSEKDEVQFMKEFKDVPVMKNAEPNRDSTIMKLMSEARREKRKRA